MKKSYFYFVAVTAAASVAVSCNSELEANLSDDLTKHTIIVESEAPTKTYIDEGAVVHWAETGDELGLLYKTDISSEKVVKTGGYTLDDEGRAKHIAEISTVDGALQYIMMAFYPYKSIYSPKASKIAFLHPEKQTPSESSYDPKADFLISTNPKTFSSLPGSVSFSFHRPVAIAKMTIAGIVAGEKISKIEFTASENIAGNFYADMLTENLENRVTYTGGSYYYKTITLDMQDRVATGSDVVYFTTLPADLTGKSFSVKVTTDGHIYSKDIALTDREFKLEAATLTKFVVANMTVSDLPAEYALLKDASALKAGDKMVICNSGVSAKSTYSSQYLLGTQASGSKIAKSDQIYVTDDLTIVEPLPLNSRVFTLEIAADGKWYLKAQDGYLYADYDEANWNSTLAVADSKSDSWTISVESTGKTSIQSSNSNRYISYSSSYYTFSAAGSTSSAVYAYVLPSKDTPEGPTTEQLATPTISDVSVDGSSVTISWTAVVGAADYDVKLADGYAQTGVTATEYTFTNVPDGTYSASGIAVIANPASTDEAHTSSAPASWSSDVVVKTTPDVETETTIVFDLKDYYDKSEIKDSDEIITITHNGSWRNLKDNGWDGIWLASSKYLKIAINQQLNKSMIKIVLIGVPEGSSSYKSMNISSLESDTLSGPSGKGEYANGQYTWSGGEESNYVKFNTGSSTSISKIEVTYK